MLFDNIMLFLINQLLRHENDENNIVLLYFQIVVNIKNIKTCISDNKVFLCFFYLQ